MIVRKLSSGPNFDRAIIFDKNLIAIHMKKTEVYFNKPVYVDQVILDLSKTLMFDFHYNYIQKKYKDRAELLFTDTDSLLYQIHTYDFYKDIKKNVIKKKLDFEDYVDCLFLGKKQMRTMKIIRSENHDIYSKEINKIALSNENDKREVLLGKVKTIALR